MPKFSVDKLISKYGLQGGRESLTPYALENAVISARQLRKLYTELRDIANKRIKRAQKAGYGQNLVIRQGAKKIPKISEIRTEAELRYRIGETAMLLENPLSTISGIERNEAKKLETLARHGYEFGNEGNLQDFGRFMEWVRASYSDRLYDSDTVSQLYKTVTKGGFTTRAIKRMFDEYMDRTMLLAMVDKIYDKIDHQEKQDCQKKEQLLYQMNLSLLGGEIYHRRCRYRRKQNMFKA